MDSSSLLALDEQHQSATPAFERQTEFDDSPTPRGRYSSRRRYSAQPLAGAPVSLPKRQRRGRPRRTGLENDGQASLITDTLIARTGNASLTPVRIGEESGNAMDIDTSFGVEEGSPLTMHGETGSSHAESSYAQREKHVPHATATGDGNSYAATGGIEPANRRRRRGGPSVPDAIGGKPVPTQVSTLASPTLCRNCGALRFMYESKGFCCSEGQVRIASNDYPQKLIDLFTKTDDDSKHFQKYSRLYNNLFAFTSLGGSFDVISNQGIYTFKVHGQMYHFLPDLLPTNNTPKYLQLYFYDVQHEKENRLGFFPQLLPSVISTLMEVMEENPYACFFKSLSDFNVTENSRILLNQNSTLDQRVYNAPAADEVAAVWLDSSSSQQSGGPHIVAYGKSDKSHRIMHYYGCYDPLQYPLLFPKGDFGWHQGLLRLPKDGHTEPINAHALSCAALAQTAGELLGAEARVVAERIGKKGKHISCKEYYCYKLQIRPQNLLLRGGRLFQQYIVDMYIKLENTRLDFYRNYQDVIRAELYQEMVDTAVQGESDAKNVGHRVILPPSFIGGPRDMSRRYLNSMALVQKYGKPDLFLTMTCNANWKEIKDQLGKGELAQNRPELVARVFHSKLIAMKKQIMEKKVFGEVAALIYSVEFQKRGLPHAHFLIILKNGHKINSPESFDDYVTAEIPNTDNPHLRASVIRHMMHGPCGHGHLDCPCMRREGRGWKCKSNFPKNYNEYTTTGEDCYPMYRRRDTGEKVRVKGADLDNRWVIPYNPYLLAMFDCHINVEICSSIKAVKYLYKYVYKGHDRVSFSVVEGAGKAPIDEIERYQAGRWVSPAEAAWRIFGFDLFEIYPPVMPLPVHIENMQYVRFGNNENLQDIINDGNNSKTLLTEFFAFNAQRPAGPKYLYADFPEHFVWDAKYKCWKDRKRGGMIGRVATVAPGDGERYYLRLLLANVPGPTSFQDLLLVGGYHCATFQESALKRGLLESDESIEKCMDEASLVQMPHALRRLFATILVFCEPSDPKKFWLKYYGALSQDYKHQYPHNEGKVLQLTSEKVEAYLEGMGKCFSMYGLDHLHKLQDKTIRRTRDVVGALEAPVPEEYLMARKDLNAEQRVAYKAIIHRVKAGEPGAFFIDGPGGTGKTFLYCALYAKVRAMGKICLPTATSGIAASNIPTGRTAHSRFKIPTDEAASLSCVVAKQGALATLLQNTALIIWDEASMAKRENIEALDLLLRDVCENQLPFGGKIVVFGGDFRQVLPVLPRRTQQEAVEASLVSSYIWPQLQKFKLTQNIRARQDPVFSDFLLNLGNGALQTRGDERIQLPAGLLMPDPQETGGLGLLTNFVFPELATYNLSPDIFTERAILTAKNDDVDAINALLIEEFPGGAHVYRSFDSVVDDKHTMYPTEFLNTLCPGGMSPHKLSLKENSPVILLRNLDPASGLCNGTRLICKRFFPNMIECEISTGYYKGELVFLPRITLKPSATSKYPFQLRRRQFPIKLSFAMTINKAQGQTLQRVGIYLPTPCFSHGQLYVALSRAKTADQVRVFSGDADEEPGSPGLVKNIIAFEVLRRSGVIG